MLRTNVQVKTHLESCQDILYLRTKHDTNVADTYINFLTITAAPPTLTVCDVCYIRTKMLSRLDNGPTDRLKQFKLIKDDLYFYNNVLFRGARIIIPTSLEKQLNPMLLANFKILCYLHIDIMFISKDKKPFDRCMIVA